MYSGKASLQVIREVKSAVKIPVIGNGDVTDYESAKAMLDYTGCDGIMVGRGAVGNPFLFREIVCALESRECPPVTLEEKVNIALLQLRLAIEDKGERIAVPEARKQIALYLRSFKGAARLRAEINQATEYREVERILMQVLEEE